MTGRERFTAIMDYQPFDRMPVLWFDFWGETRDRWLTEGLSMAAAAPEETGMDPDWERGMWSCHDLVNNRPISPRSQEVIEDHPDHRIVRTAFGALQKVSKSSESMPHHIEEALKPTRESWNEFKKFIDPSDPLPRPGRPRGEDRRPERPRARDVLPRRQPLRLAARLAGHRADLVPLVRRPRAVRRDHLDDRRLLHRASPAVPQASPLRVRLLLRGLLRPERPAAVARDVPPLLPQALRPPAGVLPLVRREALPARQRRVRRPARALLDG